MQSYITRIPFAFSTTLNKLVAADEVERGIKCDCICPSCKESMISRQGDINQPHFAHYRKSVDERIKSLCEYSYYGSVRAMILQLLSNGMEIQLPMFEYAVPRFEENALIPVLYSTLVTQRTRIVLQQIEYEARCYQSTVDIKCLVKNYPFFIFIEHPERGIPDGLKSIAHKKCGIIVIDISRISEYLASRKRSISEKLMDFIINDETSKSWIYHPRLDKVKDQITADDNRSFVDVVKKQPEIYECVTCEVIVKASSKGITRCHKCNEFLYLSPRIT